MCGCDVGEVPLTLPHYSTLFSRWMAPESIMQNVFNLSTNVWYVNHHEWVVGVCSFCGIAFRIPSCYILAIEP